MRKFTEKNDWRSFQAQLQLKKKRKRRILKLARYAVPLIVLVVLVSSGLITGNLPPSIDQQDKEPPDTLSAPPQFTTSELKTLLSEQKLFTLQNDRFTVEKGGKQYTFHTTLDAGLQKLLWEKLENARKRDRGKPRDIAIVAMDPVSGHILAMAGFHLADPDANPCLGSRYPAASVFKIVSAAAAVENLGYKPGTPLYFNGMKYTLYKNQLKDTRNRYTVKTTLEEAFAESINPVFGKIGRNRLGGTVLEKYAHAFGFNQKIDAALDFSPGRVLITEEPYQWAEVACGFNFTTTISPLFAAMITSSVVNSGRMPLPAVIQKVTDQTGKTVYKAAPKLYNRPINPETALTLSGLMKKTITKGTARKEFRDAARDPVLSRLFIGGKTGSLYNRAHTVKYDWFTGFAKPKESGKKLVVSIVVGHRKYIGTRAAAYGKIIFKTYFEEYLSKTPAGTDAAAG